jgi:dolichol-phosphate mannosyltransferase
MKKVLITGGSGFIGANLARRLLADGHEINLLMRAGFSDWRIREIRTQVAIHTLDTGCGEAVGATLRRIKPDWVFHLAAHGAYSFQDDVGEMVRTNYVCTTILVQACLKTGVGVMVHAGSSSEYGDKDHAPAEQEGGDPNSYYAVTKAAATQFCRFAARKHRMPIPTLRLYSVYGPYEDPRRFIPTLLVHAMDHRWPPLVGPETVRDFVFVEDVNDALIALALTPPADYGEIYNLGTGIQTTIGEAVKITAGLFDIKEEPVWNSMPPRSWDTRVWVSNPAKIKAGLGWSPKTGLRQGLQSVAGWLQASPPRLDFYRQQILSR